MPELPLTVADSEMDTRARLFQSWGHPTTRDQFAADADRLAARAESIRETALQIKNIGQQAKLLVIADDLDQMVKHLRGKV